jgi:chromosome partitioning protein
MAYIYAVTNQKGGVGKTATCICLSAALAEHDKRVLLIDLDPQGGLTTALGFDPDSFATTIYTILIDDGVPLDKAITKSKTDGVHFVPANLDLAGAEGELLGEIGWDRTLKVALDPVQESYDYIFLDCPPSLGVLTTNALIAAQRVMIPVQTEYLAMRGLKQLTQVLSKVRRKGNPQLKAKVLRTLHQSRTIHSTEASAELENVLEGRIYKTIIHRTIKFAEASVAGEPILSYLPKSKGATLYRELAKEVLEDE